MPHAHPHPSPPPVHTQFLFCGNVAEGGEGTPGERLRRVAIAVEPNAPVRCRTYRCDSVFHTAELRAGLHCDGTRTGFIVLNGSGVLLAVVSESEHRILSTLRGEYGCATSC